MFKYHDIYVYHTDPHKYVCMYALPIIQSTNCTIMVNVLKKRTWQYYSTVNVRKHGIGLTHVQIHGACQKNNCYSLGPNNEIAVALVLKHSISIHM